MDKVWLRNYPPGVPETIDPDQYSSLVAALDEFCETYSNHIAFSNFGSELTYHQLAQYSRQLAAYLQNVLRLQSGDRVALMMPNLLQYPISVLAILRAGLVAVNINPLYTARELACELQDSGASAIIVLENYAAIVAKVLAQVPSTQVIVTKIGDLFGTLKGAFYNCAAKYIKRAVSPWEISGVHYFKQALEYGAQYDLQPPLIMGGDPAFLQYTGGTTGVPKGAILTHRNLVANLLQCSAWIRGELTLGAEVLLVALPLYHIFSLTVSCFAFLAIGGHCLLITDPRDMRSLIKIWRKNLPSCFMGLNTLMLHLLKRPEFTQIDFRGLKLTVAGGMSTHPQIAQQWQVITHCVVVEGYGLTEASPVVAINPLNIAHFNQSVGLPIPATDVKVCDEKYQELSFDEVGELWVKGPQVMKGYWRNPAETKKVLDNEGWLRTGDLARIDAQGFIYLVDRKKDMIIVSGFNVYPNEVEAVIALHPAVAEVGVIGVPDPKTGEIVKAVIVKKDPALTAEMIIDFCQRQLTHYKIPKQIEFRDFLPKSPVGKILRRELR